MAWYELCSTATTAGYASWRWRNVGQLSWSLLPVTKKEMTFIHTWPPAGSHQGPPDPWAGSASARSRPAPAATCSRLCAVRRPTLTRPMLVMAMNEPTAWPAGGKAGERGQRG